MFKQIRDIHSGVIKKCDDEGLYAFFKDDLDRGLLGLVDPDHAPQAELR